MNQPWIKVKYKRYLFSLKIYSNASPLCGSSRNEMKRFTDRPGNMVEF